MASRLVLAALAAVLVGRGAHAQSAPAPRSNPAHPPTPSLPPAARPPARPPCRSGKHGSDSNIRRELLCIAAACDPVCTGSYTCAEQCIVTTCSPGQYNLISMGACADCPAGSL